MNDQAAAKNDHDSASVDIDLNADKAEGKEGKTPKTKLVRDSFTIPKAEYATLNELRQRSTRLAQPAKKSELLRAGIELLKGLSDEAFLAALGAVPNLKTGRPKKEGEESDEPAVKTGRKIIDKIAKRPTRGSKTAAKSEDETGAAKPAKTAKSPAARKAAKATKKAAVSRAPGAKAKPGKAAKAGAKAGKAAKAQRANRGAADDDGEEI